MKNVHRVSTKATWGHEIGVSPSKNATILQAMCAGALSCWKV